jgi:hypothetical protein
MALLWPAERLASVLRADALRAAPARLSLLATTSTAAPLRGGWDGRQRHGGVAIDAEDVGASVRTPPASAGRRFPRAESKETVLSVDGAIEPVSEIVESNLGVRAVDELAASLWQ